MIASHRHLRAGRILAGLSRSELAKLAKLSIITIKRMESFGGLIGHRSTTIRRLEEALETAGVVFTRDGLRMKRQRKKKNSENGGPHPTTQGAALGAMGTESNSM